MILSMPKSHFSHGIRPIWLKFCHQFLTTSTNARKTRYRCFATYLPIPPPCASASQSRSGPATTRVPSNPFPAENRGQSGTIGLNPAPRSRVIDDLQWCSRESLEWLHYLLRFDPRTPLLLVGTCHPEELDEL
jgi:hypothetical protein